MKYTDAQVVRVHIRGSTTCILHALTNYAGLHSSQLINNITHNCSNLSRKYSTLKIIYINTNVDMPRSETYNIKHYALMNITRHYNNDAQ